MHLEEKTLSSEKKFSGKVVDLYVDKAELEDGKEVTRELIIHPGGACVVPIDSEGNIYMVKQFRYPFKTVLTEIPAGKLNSADENPREAALRELKEETGAVSGKVTELGICYPTVAYDSEKIYMYLCEELTFDKNSLDEDEFLDLVKMPFKEAVQMVMDNKLPDAKTQIAILKAARILENR